MKIRGLILWILLSVSSSELAAQIVRRPNLIFVFADQLRADALGYYGNQQAITPNIDAFSEQSVDFTNAVSVTPVCAPYRASFLTGKYTSSTGMVINELNMNPNHRTIAHVLGEAGYDLGYIGKVHLNDRHHRSYQKGLERFGFDGYWAANSFNHNSYRSFYFTDNEDGTEKKVDLTGKYDPEVFTDLACDYIKDVSEKEQPFALFLSWNPPHDPWVRQNVDPLCYERFKDMDFELPPNFKEAPDAYMDRYNPQFFEGDTAWRNTFLHEGGYEEMMRSYYAMVNSIDEQFGRILTLIDTLGITENTIIVFTSDHGEMFTSQGRMFKLTFYEEAARVPFLLRYPALETCGTSDVTLNTPDIAPTLLGLMGLRDQIPSGMEGMDLSFAVQKVPGVEPEFAFMQGMGHTYQWIDGFEWRAVRDKRYTYAKYLRDGSEFLFDRSIDPYQKVNLVDDAAYEAVLRSLRVNMNKKMEELGDEFHECTWYREHWMYKDYSIKAAAKGEFGPLPPIEPQRGQ